MFHRIAEFPQIRQVPMVGIAGRLHSGKDEFADQLIAMTGFSKLWWADELKLRTQKSFQFTDQEMLEKPPVVHRALQFIGTNIFRALDPRYWLTYWESWVLRGIQKELPRGGKISYGVVVSDTRFDNEVRLILDNGGWVFYIDAEDRLGPVDPSAHESELAAAGLMKSWYQKPGFVVVRNNGSLEEYRTKVEMILLNWLYIMRGEWCIRLPENVLANGGAIRPLYE